MASDIDWQDAIMTVCIWVNTFLIKEVLNDTFVGIVSGPMHRCHLSLLTAAIWVCASLDELLNDLFSRNECLSLVSSILVSAKTRLNDRGSVLRVAALDNRFKAFLALLTRLGNEERHNVSAAVSCCEVKCRVLVTILEQEQLLPQNVARSLVDLFDSLSILWVREVAITGCIEERDEVIFVAITSSVLVSFNFRTATSHAFVAMTSI